MLAYLVRTPGVANLRPAPEAITCSSSNVCRPTPLSLRLYHSTSNVGGKTSFSSVSVVSAMTLAAGVVSRRSAKASAFRNFRAAAAQTAARATSAQLPSSVKLHLYDHCPFCVRAQLVLGWLNIPYEPVLYHYGEGADPEKCDGQGYNPKEGPVALTGFKMLPVLEGNGVPAPAAMKGLPESLEICSYLAACKHGIAPATGRSDISDWLQRLGPVNGQLIKPRIIKMPLKDWADPRDVAYSKWKYTKQGFDYAKAEASTPELLEGVASLLQELVPMLRGRTEEGVPTLNSWGFGIDDVLVLPLLRNLTCVKGITWPPLIKEYVEKSCAKTGISLYTEHAC